MLGSGAQPAQPYILGWEIPSHKANSHRIIDILDMGLGLNLGLDGTLNMGQVHKIYVPNGGKKDVVARIDCHKVDTSWANWAEK